MDDAPILLANAALRVEISPLGAELIGLADVQGRAYLWNGDAQFWSGRAPLLFPMVGRAPNDRIRIDGVDHGLPQHGFARRSRFALVDAADSRAKFRLEDNPTTREAFPFAFRLEVDFALRDSSLTVTATVENRDTKPLPCGFGFHPAFRWPLPDAAGAHKILFERDETAPFFLLDDGLLAPEPQPCPVKDRQLALDPEIFARGALVFKALNSRKVTLQAAEGPRISVAFPDLPHFGLWSKPGAPFVCIEPWQGYAAPVGEDAEFSRRPGVVVLAPGDARHFAMTIEVAA